MWGAVIGPRIQEGGGESSGRAMGRGGSSRIKADFFLTKLIQGFLS